MRPVAIIPAPQGRANPNVTGYAIGFVMVPCAFGVIPLVMWLASLNGFV